MASAGIRILRLSQIGLEDAAVAKVGRKLNVGVERARSQLLYPQCCMPPREGFELFSLNAKRPSDWLVPTSDMNQMDVVVQGEMLCKRPEPPTRNQSRTLVSEALSLACNSRHPRHLRSHQSDSPCTRTEAPTDNTRSSHHQVKNTVVVQKAMITKSSELFVLPPWQMPTGLSAPNPVWYSLCMHPTTVHEE